ncbi:MAG: hypothetical protein ACKOWJ_04715 [Micrococcales bacterium]
MPPEVAVDCDADGVGVDAVDPEFEFDELELLEEFELLDELLEPFELELELELFDALGELLALAELLGALVEPPVDVVVFVLGAAKDPFDTAVAD